MKISNLVSSVQPEPNISYHGASANVLFSKHRIDPFSIILPKGMNAYWAVKTDNSEVKTNSAKLKRKFYPLGPFMLDISTNLQEAYDSNCYVCTASNSLISDTHSAHWEEIDHFLSQNYLWKLENLCFVAWLLEELQIRNRK